MKSERKKIQRNFRLEPSINDELESRAMSSGIAQTTILEDALRSYFGARSKDAEARRRFVVGFPKTAARGVDALTSCALAS